MKLTLTNERGEAVTLDLAPGENAFLALDGVELPPGTSLYLDPRADTLGFGAYSEEAAWWEHAETLPITRL